jgi:hypothetical protein
MKILLFIIFVAGLVFLFIELPVLTGRGAREVREGIATTAQPSLERQFNLDFSHVTNVVIVGDFLDSVWDFESFGTTDEERFEAVLQGIVPPSFTGNIYYIHALTHDPQHLNTNQLSFPNFEFYHIGRYGKFLVDGVSVVAYHGDQLHGGFVGGGVSWLFDKVGQPLWLERLGRTRFNIPQDTWIINGHSHVPGIIQKEKVANTGSFVGAPFNKYIFRIHIGTGVLFDNGKVELQKYQGLNIKKRYLFSI